MHQIKYVLSASKSLNFTKAAGDCNVSQPALTSAIKKLEAELGYELFFREGKKVMLTNFGRTMLPHFQQIAEGAQIAHTMAENFRLLRQIPIRLGVLRTIGPARLARFLSAFHAEHIGVEVAVQEGAIGDLIGRLESVDLDLAILNPGEGLGDNFRVETLYPERYLVILPPHHRLATRNGIRLQDLGGEDYVDRLSCEYREIVMAACANSGIELYARFRSEREDWIEAMVTAGIGFAFMPEYSTTAPDVNSRPLIEPAVTRKVSLVSVAGRRHSPAVAAFVRAARRYKWQ
jgi:DNA-binding transcriptional LysR family regulator